MLQLIPLWVLGYLSRVASGRDKTTLTGEPNVRAMGRAAGDDDEWMARDGCGGVDVLLHGPAKIARRKAHQLRCQIDGNYRADQVRLKAEVDAEERRIRPGAGWFALYWVISFTALFGSCHSVPSSDAAGAFVIFLASISVLPAMIALAVHRARSTAAVERMKRLRGVTW